MIKGIFFDVEFNDYIDDKKFVSPGAYVISLGEKEISIDFADSYGSINKDEKTLHVEGRYADLDYCPEMETLTKEDLILAELKEINIYVYNDLENEECFSNLKPVSITDVTIVCDGSSVRLKANPDNVEILTY